MQTETDVLIIGAGPAGSVAAALLQREGLRVRIVEKQQFPRFVIGESLLPHGMDFLQEAGLLDCIEKQGFMQKSGAVFYHGDEACDFNFADQFTPGWKYTWQVTRADFDKALADEVASRGVPIQYGETVFSVDFAPGNVSVKLQGAHGRQHIVTAKFLLDCSGYGRVLPRLLDLEIPSRFPPRAALFAHVTGDHRPAGADAGKIWICVHPEGAWLWVIPFSNGKTSVGIVGDPDFFKCFPYEPEKQFREIVAGEPNTAARMAGMQLAFEPRRIDGFSCSVKQLYGPGYALAGNATEFLDPIFSSGVMLAMASGSRAAKIIARELRGETVDWETEYAGYVKSGVNTFRAFVSAWYEGALRDILFSSAKSPEIMRQVCSVLAGYVWDKRNPYASQPERALPVLLKVVQARARADAN